MLPASHRIASHRVCASAHARTYVRTYVCVCDYVRADMRTKWKRLCVLQISRTTRTRAHKVTHTNTQQKKRDQHSIPYVHPERKTLSLARPAISPRARAHARTRAGHRCHWRARTRIDRVCVAELHNSSSSTRPQPTAVRRTRSSVNTEPRSYADHSAPTVFASIQHFSWPFHQSR